MPLCTAGFEPPEGAGSVGTACPDGQAVVHAPPTARAIPAAPPAGGAGGGGGPLNSGYSDRWLLVTPCFTLVIHNQYC